MKVKQPIIQLNGQKFQRVWVKTHIVTDKDEITNVVENYTKGLLHNGDIVTIAESVVAITQGRAIPITRIKPGFLAKNLWRFVRKVPYGIGLHSPWSMECAIREVGGIRIILAALVSAFGKILGRRGDFYRIAGKQAAMIDAAHTSGVKEFYECVIMGPKDPELTAQRISQKIQHPVAIVDANDISGCWVVGASKGFNTELVAKVMDDNPAGQGDSLTPIIVIRRIE
jgi:F420-0:gamma-glutamyl ligase-like protein